MENEKIMDAVMRMVQARRDWYAAEAKKKDISDLAFSYEALSAAYNDVAWMLDYALHGDWEALRQYDYFEKVGE